MALHLRYEPKANAAYIRFLPEPVQDSEEVSSDIALDYNAASHILGMEALDARTLLSPAVLTTALLQPPMSSRP